MRLKSRISVFTLWPPYLFQNPGFYFYALNRFDTIYYEIDFSTRLGPPVVSVHAETGQSCYSSEAPALPALARQL
jgi:hypothetical protein